MKQIDIIMASKVYCIKTSLLLITLVFIPSKLDHYFFNNYDVCRNFLYALLLLCYLDFVMMIT